MTAHPVPENAGHWWLTTRSTWNRLHAVPGPSLAYDALREAIDEGRAVDRTAACGPALALVLPGISSRISLPRCAHCCRALGVPRGKGTPCNEAAFQQGKTADQT